MPGNIEKFTISHGQDFWIVVAVHQPPMSKDFGWLGGIKVGRGKT